MAGFDLDRLQRLARGFAALFYALLFLAFITAVMGSGGGGLLLLVLAAVAHVGRVGLEELVARREGGATLDDEDAGERATGLRLRWLPSELRLGGAGGRAAGAGEAAGVALGRAGEVAGAATGRAGEALATARSSIGVSLSALVAEIREPRGRVEAAFDEEPGFEALSDDFDYDDYEDESEDFEEPIDFDAPVELEPVAEVPRPERVSAASAPNAQERYEARERTRRERRGFEPLPEDEPLVAAVEAAESEPAPRVRRRSSGGRPDPLRTRRPTRTI